MLLKRAGSTSLAFLLLSAQFATLRAVPKVADVGGSYLAAAAGRRQAPPARVVHSATPTTTTLDGTAPSGTFVINDDAATVGDPWNGTLYEQTLTGTASEGSGGPVVQAAFSNDGAHWRYEAASDGAFSTDWTIYDTTYGSDPNLAAGVFTVYGKWRDFA